MLEICSKIVQNSYKNYHIYYVVHKRLFLRFDHSIQNRFY
jgi:hypothetical protein